MPVLRCTLRVVRLACSAAQSILTSLTQFVKYGMIVIVDSVNDDEQPSGGSARAEAGYPLVLTGLARRRCIVVGGGAVAQRKVAGLLDAAAHPEVISPTLTAALAGWHARGAISYQQRQYHDGDLEGAALVIAATGDRAVNAAVAAECDRRGILVNIADDPAASNFHTVGAVRRGDLLLTVSTGGVAPALAGHVRRTLEQQYGEEYGQLLRLLGAFRPGAVARLTPAQRAAFWQTLPYDTLLAQLRSGERRAAESALQRQFAQVHEETE